MTYTSNQLCFSHLLSKNELSFLIHRFGGKLSMPKLLRMNGFKKMIISPKKANIQTIE